jgi:hypothetical protein
LKANRNTSIRAEAPKTAAQTMSLASPDIRDNSVIEPTTEVDSTSVAD